MVTKTITSKTDAPARARRSAAVENEPRAANGRWSKIKTSDAKPKPTARKGHGKDYTTGAMLGAAAAGLAVGLAANIARKFAVQAPTLLGGDWDQALAGEHRLTIKVFDALEATDDKATLKRVALLANLKHMLSKHATEEENVIYPALREIGETEAADALNTEHGYVKQYLFELTELAKGSSLFLPKLAAFRADLEKHIREEEAHLFPLLKGRLSQVRNAELTAQMNKEGLKLA